MSEVVNPSSAPADSIECVLSVSDCYVETLSIQAINALPGQVELVIHTQLLSSKNPSEKRVKSRTCINESQLSEIREAISHFLKVSPKRSASSSGDPVSA